MILVHLVNQYESYATTTEAFQRRQKDIDRFRPLFDYLGQNCGNPPYVREAARVCGMSQIKNMRIFKRVTGQSFTRYMNKFRMERAQSLLASTASMACISQQLGFSDQSHFGMVFRKVSGMTPASYRRYFQKASSSDSARELATLALGASQSARARVATGLVMPTGDRWNDRHRGVFGQRWFSPMSCGGFLVRVR